MDKKELKVYTASSVGIDYFFFLTRTIAAAGFEVEPLYLIAEQDYRKLAKSSGLSKIWLRIQMYIVYPLYLVYRGVKCPTGSTFVVSSNTFFAPYLVHFTLRFKKIKVVHMLYDLFPDAIEIAGAIKVNSKISTWIGKISKANQSKCEATVYLGDFLRKHAELRWGKAVTSQVIDISTDLSLYQTDLMPLVHTEKIVVHYGGQLGHLHDAKSIIESVKFVCNSDIQDKVEFNFYVSGAQAQFLEDSLSGFSVKIISAMPSHQWRLDIQSFHIGLVSLSPGGASVCLPSKTYGMMAGGMAIMAICPLWSDLGQLVENLDAGWVINNSPFDQEIKLTADNYLDNLGKMREIELIVQDFYQTLKNILANRQELELKRTHAFSGVRNHYNIMNLSDKWAKVILNI